jgi:DNA polymerase-3 subunit gamma/tau
MSLYRKYRPQTFADVVGQDAVVTTLEQAAEQDKLSHAFLFAGSRGTGKTSVARILAKILMTQGVTDEIIQQQIIKGVEEGHIVDLLEIDAASNRGIDDVRDLIEKIQFSPVVAGAKVYIIDEVHMLTKEAFNALLKTLEEPPEYAYFILATTELHKIPSTIQSRCQCFPFRPIPEEEIVRRLQFIADQEKIIIEREALRAIAHHAQGGMRDAISMLDQMHSLPKITLEDVEQRMGKTGSEYVEEIFRALDEQDAPALLQTVRRIEESGIALDVFLRTLLSTVRTMLHEAIEKKLSTVQLQFILGTLLQATRDVRIAPVPGLILESALISLCRDPAELTRKEAPIKLAKPQQEKPEKAEKKEAIAASEEEPEEKGEENAVKKEVEAEKTEALKDASVEAVELSLEGIQSLWQQVVDATTPASVKMSLKNGQPLAVSEKTITLGFTSSFHRNNVMNPEASRKIEEVMQHILRRSLKLECTIGDIADSMQDSSAEPSVNVAQAAAEIF